MAANRMHFSLEQKIIAGFCVALVALAVLGAGAWLSVTRFQSTFRWVDHTHQVLFEMEALLNHVLSVQTESQRYVITGDETCLDRWSGSMRRAEASFQRLNDLTADNPAQNGRVARLQPLLASAALLTQQRHVLRQQQGQAAAITEMGRGALREVVDQLVQRVQAAEMIERNLLKERVSETLLAGDFTLTAALASSLIAALLAALALILALRDIHARKKAEARLDRFFDLSRDMLCIAGFDGYFKRLNPAWEKALGFTLEELKARPYLEFLHPEDRAITQTQAARQSEGLDAVSFENRYLCKDGSYRWLLWNAHPSVSDQLIFATARDITEHKRNEARIHQLNADLEQRAVQLEAANKELEAFSYSVSHDLRAPLRHIHGFAKLLTKHAATSLDDQACRYVATISEAASKMGRLIDDLLTFSRMSRTHLSLVEIDQDALVAAVIREGHLSQHERVSWRITSLPRVRADHAMLQQVWFNYLDNAVKYSAGAAQPCIEISGHIETAAGEIVCQVRDNGAGFDMAYGSKLFGVFQRLHTDDEFEGTGIGLANVRRIISRHGGRTWAEGRVGAGATFYFSLPLSPVATPVFSSRN